MRNFRHLNIPLILKIIGQILLGVGFFMWIPLLLSFFDHETKIATAFGLSSGITLSTAFLFRFVFSRNARFPILRKEGFLIVALIWIVIPFFGCLPYLLSGVFDGFSDAYFESISGFTATGATVFKDVESLPRGILFWRSFSQWMGGGGLAMFTIALVKYLKESAQHLYIAEVSGPIKPKFHPKIIQATRQFLGIYLLMTLCLFVLLSLGEMNIFDSICHAMSTVSTGGFSTRNLGLAEFSDYSQNVIAIFMFFSGINLSLLYLLFSGHPLKLWNDEQFRWYFRIISIFVIIVCLGSLYFGHNFWKSLHYACFTVVSIISTTGYYITIGHTGWGSILPILLFFLMFVGGCAGSTAGGIKITRVILLLKYVFSQFKRQLHPQAIIPIKYNKKIVKGDIVNITFAFFFLYVLFVLFGGLTLTLCGQSIRSALSLSAAAIGNIGPAVVNLCSTCSFAELIPLEKWVLSFLMLAGRLEIFTLVALFSPSFWRS